MDDTQAHMREDDTRTPDSGSASTPIDYQEFVYVPTPKHSPCHNRDISTPEFSNGFLQIVDAAREHGPNLLFVMLAQWTGSAPLVLFAHILFLTSIMAGAVSYHASCARYMYALGREGVLPRRLGDTGRRTGAPVPASLAQSALGGAAIILFAVMGWDPLTRLFYWLGAMGGIGLLTLLTVTSIAVIVYTTRSGQDAPGIGAGITLPLIAAGLMAAGLVVTGQNLPLLLGVDPGSRWLWIWPATFAAVIVVGLIRAAVMRLDCHTYRQIGAGVAATTIPTPASTQPAPPSRR